MYRNRQQMAHVPRMPRRMVHVPKTDDARTYCTYAKQLWYMSKNCKNACIFHNSHPPWYMYQKNKVHVVPKIHKKIYNMYHNVGHAKNYNPWAMGLVP